MASEAGPPSPVMPIIVLTMLGIMMVIPTYFRYEPYLSASLQTFQRHFTVGALLIPVLLVLAVQSFGLPQGNNRSSPGSVAHTASNSTPTFLICFLILLLVLIPLHSALHSTWQPPPPPYMMANRYGYRKPWFPTMY